ncbi:hypothetical protein CIG19_01270 [Enterobacterales bacterium CwR94]|nr:hypothetical protein CIG19_01270 [Enterobacterales bacterium CwR94]
MDARLDEYQAIVSSFNGKKNLITAKGFWNDNPAGEVSEDDTFYVGDNYYKGKISSDGNYVSPVELDCSSEAFPGVWDIKEEKRVVFDDREGPLSIDEKCKNLFTLKN